MDKLEKFIVENRQEFDTYEPSGDLWDNIVPPKSRIITANFAKIAWRAAAAIVLFIGAFSVSEYRHRNDQPVAQSRAETPQGLLPELREAEAFYGAQVSTMLSQVKQHPSFNTDLQQDLDVDMKELDFVYKELKDDLQDNIANQEVIDAMIQNYRIKLQVLEGLMEQLKHMDGAGNQLDNKSSQHAI